MHLFVPSRVSSPAGKEQYPMSGEKLFNYPAREPVHLLATSSCGPEQYDMVSNTWALGGCEGLYRLMGVSKAFKGL